MGECLIIRSGGGTDTSGATATASVVLAGYTCYVNDNKITGSMPAQTLNRTLNAGGSVTIPAGYYNGSSVISTSTLAGETAANAASSHILSGYNAWVNGTNTWGNMPNRGNISHSLPANGSYTIPAGWHAGGGVVNQSLAFHWGGTYTPNTANQVICWANWYAAGNIVVLGSSALTAGNIRNGVWIFGVLGNFTGWVDSTLNLSTFGTEFNTRYYQGWITHTIRGFWLSSSQWASCCESFNRVGYQGRWTVYHTETSDKASPKCWMFKISGSWDTIRYDTEYVEYGELTRLTTTDASSTGSSAMYTMDKSTGTNVAICFHWQRNTNSGGVRVSSMIYWNFWFAK